MIGCHGDNYKLGWFHITYLKIPKVPKGGGFALIVGKINHPVKRAEKSNKKSLISAASYYVDSTTDSQQLHKAQQVTTILSIIILLSLSHMIVLMEVYFVIIWYTFALKHR